MTTEVTAPEPFACPECGAKAMRPDYRVTVGGRTLYRCGKCGTSAVDDNEEPHASPKDVKLNVDWRPA